MLSSRKCKCLNEKEEWNRKWGVEKVFGLLNIKIHWILKLIDMQSQWVSMPLPPRPESGSSVRTSLARVLQGCPCLIQSRACQEMSLYVKRIQLRSCSAAVAYRHIRLQRCSTGGAHFLWYFSKGNSYRFDIIGVVNETVITECFIVSSESREIHIKVGNSFDLMKHLWAEWIFHV